MSYMRSVVGRCYRVSTHPHSPRKIKENRYSIDSREDVTTRTSFAWRLSCGHVLDGQQGHGKMRKHCHYCEWIAEGRDFITPEGISNQSASWTDIPSDEAYEAIRRQAQS